MADPIILLRQIDPHTRLYTYSVVSMGFLFALFLFIHWIIVFAGLLAWRPNDLRNEEAEVEMTTCAIDNSSSEVHHHHSDIALSFAGVQETHDLYVSTRRPNDLRNEEAEMTTYAIDNSSSEDHEHHSDVAPSFAGIQTHDCYYSTRPLLVAPADLSTQNHTALDEGVSVELSTLFIADYMTTGRVFYK